MIKSFLKKHRPKRGTLSIKINLYGEIMTKPYYFLNDNEAIEIEKRRIGARIKITHPKLVDLLFLRKKQELYQNKEGGYFIVAKTPMEINQFLYIWNLVYKNTPKDLSKIRQALIREITW